MGETVDLQPQVDEVLQVEAEELTTVPVRVAEVCAPVRVQALPRKAASSRTRRLGADRAERVLLADHRRARAVLVAPAPFLVGFSEASAQDASTMAWWPGGVPFECGAVAEVWVRAAAEATEVSVVTERWAAGE